MFSKKMLAATVLAVFGTSAFAQTTLTAAQCVEAGGVVNQETNTCTISAEDLAAYQQSGAAAVTTAATLGGGIGGGAAFAALAVVLAATGGGSSGTTTTTD